MVRINLILSYIRWNWIEEAVVWASVWTVSTGHLIIIIINIIVVQCRISLCWSAYYYYRRSKKEVWLKGKDILLHNFSH